MPWHTYIHEWMNEYTELTLWISSDGPCLLCERAGIMLDCGDCDSTKSCNTKGKILIPKSSKSFHCHICPGMSWLPGRCIINYSLTRVGVLHPFPLFSVEEGLWKYLSVGYVCHHPSGWGHVSVSCLMWHGKGVSPHSPAHETGQHSILQSGTDNGGVESTVSKK